MKLISRQGKAKAAPELWANQYKGNVGPANKILTLAKLRTAEADGSISPEVVNSIIGNTSWTDVNCDECGSFVEQAVQLGEDPDYESSTAVVCFQCLEKAVLLEQK